MDIIRLTEPISALVYAVLVPMQFAFCSTGVEFNLAYTIGYIVDAVSLCCAIRRVMMARPRLRSRYKENVTTKAKHRDTGETELYNLAKDPHERNNLAKARQGRTKRLAKQLNKLLPE